jgi:hypothetical protein
MKLSKQRPLHRGIQRRQLGPISLLRTLNRQAPYAHDEGQQAEDQEVREESSNPCAIRTTTQILLLRSEASSSIPSIR